MAGTLLQQLRTGGSVDEPKPEILTRREQEILAYLGQGLTNRELAEKLFIAENTVKNHIKNLLEKLLLHNRAQLVAYAVRNGLAMK